MKFINQIFYKKKVENKGKNFFLTNRNENDLKNLMFATSDLQFFRDLSLNELTQLGDYLRDDHLAALSNVECFHFLVKEGEHFGRTERIVAQDADCVCQHRVSISPSSAEEGQVQGSTVFMYCN